MGKLITYAAGFDAGAVIWVAPTIRDEHRQALEWLNRRASDTHFFAVTVELLQVDDSRPAVNFRLVVSPSDWPPDGGDGKPSARGEAYRKFFQALIDELRVKHKFTSAKVGQPQNWYSFASGVAGITYSASFAQGGRVRTEVYIDRNDDKALFDRLLAQKAKVESEFGEALEWERLDDRRACRIATYFPGVVSSPPEELTSIRTSVIDRLLRLKRVFGPLLKQLAGPGPSEPA